MAEGEQHTQPQIVRWHGTAEESATAQHTIKDYNTDDASARSGGNVLYRLTANPQKVKTQVAKISYGSPRVQNNIAKIPKATKSSITTMRHTESSIISPLTQNSVPLPQSTTSTQEAFAKRKAEREKEIQEMQSMLNELTKSPRRTEIDPDAASTVQISTAFSDHKDTELMASKNLTYRKSRSDLHLERAHLQTARESCWSQTSNQNKPRSHSSQPVKAKSDLESGSRVKSYNPEDARRYMEEQKKRRRTNPTKFDAILHPEREKSRRDKEQIRKNLEELRKNTRKILTKSVRKKQAAPVENTNSQKESHGGIVFKKPEQRKKSSDSKDNNKDVENKEKESPAAEGDDPNTNQNEQKAAIKNNTAIQEAKVVAPIAKTKSTELFNPLTENQKRVGILRKPDLTDHSFSAIKEYSFDKENVAIDMMTPKLTGALETRVKETPAKAEDNAEQIVVMPLKKEKLLHSEKSTQVKENPSLLEVSNVKNTTKTADQNPSENRPDLPYWLRPSAVQVYPYNFIVAVRRKLEAAVSASQPMDAAEIATPLRQEEYKKLEKSKLLPTNLPKEAVKTPTKYVDSKKLASEQLQKISGYYSPDHKQDLHRKLASKVGAAEELIVASQENLIKSNSITDFSSNFSSISIQLPPSDGSSLHSAHPPMLQVKPKSSSHIKDGPQPGPEDDDTTVSSSILNSPERKPSSASRGNRTAEELGFETPKCVSPLSLERVDSLQLVSRSKSREALKRKHQIASEHSISHSDKIQSRNTSKLESKSLAENDISLNFNKFLDEFQRSLTQVIEVNEQLKSTIDKSVRVVSPHQAKKSLPIDHTEIKGTAVDEAKEDTSRKDNVLYSSDFENSPSRKSSERVDRSELLLLDKISQNIRTASTKSTVSSVRRTQSEKGIPSFELNLKSISNSSANSTEDDMLSTQNRSASQKLSDSVTEQKYESHLQNIEAVKEKLRRSIMDSRANRLADDSPSIKSPRETNAQKSYENHSPTSWNGSTHLPTKSQSFPAAEVSMHVSANEHQISSGGKSQTKSPLPMVDQQSRRQETARSSSSGSSSQRIHSESQVSMQKSIYTNSKSIPEEVKELSFQVIYKAQQKDNDSSNASNSLSTADEAKHSQIKKDEARVAHIRSHINGSRGDFFLDSLRDANVITDRNENKDRTPEEATASECSQTSSTAPLPSYKTMTPKLSKTHRKDNVSLTAHTIGEIVAVFNQPDCDLSFVSVSNASISESSISYTNVGLYDKLIQNETSKSEKLTTLLKMREKALLDRTKGQIAWLQVQKERFKAKGLVSQIAAIKKKQRAILMKMDKERDEIKRLLQTSSSTLSTESLHRQLQLPSATTPGSSPKKYLRRSRYGSMKTAGSLLPYKSAPPALPALPLGKPSPNQRGKSPRLKQGVEQEQQDQQAVTVAVTRSAPILRASYDLETNAPLEKLLERREADLRRRREHVERLMEWHRRLDQEEAEVMHMEHIILNYNRKSISPNSQSSQSYSPSHQQTQKQVQQGTKEEGAASTSAPSDRQIITDNLVTPLAEGPLPHRLKMERRIKEIDQSLRELGNISASGQSNRTGENSDTGTDSAPVDYVPITGHKLNKLWRRLTSQHIEKFEPSRRYKLCKSDLERLYEEAKRAVLKDFAQDEERITMELLERSASNLSTSTNIESQSNACGHDVSGGTASPNRTIVPRLRLNVSSEASEPDEESIAEASVRSQSHGNYSPSAAESDFYMLSTAQPQSSPEALVTATGGIITSTVQSKINMQKFMELSREFASQSTGLQRSQSDTDLKLKPQNIADPMIGTSHGNITNATFNDEVSIEKSQNAQREVEVGNGSISSPGADTLHSVQSIKSCYSRSFCNSVESQSIEQSTDIPSQKQIPNGLGSLAMSQDQNKEDEEVPPGPLDLTVKSTNSMDEGTPTEITNQTSLIPVSEVQTQTSESELYTELEQTDGSSSKTLKYDKVIESPIDEQKQNVVTLVPSEVTPTPEYDVDRRTREITARLEEISSAVQMLSQLSATSNDIESSLSCSNQAASTTLNGDDDEVSYSSKFEQLTSEWQAFKSQTTAELEAEDANSNEIEEAPTETDNLTASAIKKVFDKYESDFESSSNETQIVDISVPDFENTLEVTEDEEKPYKNENEMMGIEPLVNPTGNAVLEPQIEPKPSEVSQPPLPPPPGLPAASSSSAQHMPDIINELETRRQQNLFEAEQARHYEQVTAVPYMYVREIPNKPPPPYVPPAHGSPMTTIFPSKERIKDITYRRTHELYCAILKTDYTNEQGEKLPSVMEEKITNIYERIILDICREYLEDHQETLMQGGNPINFRSQLAFFNPPDRLLCIQESIYKEVRRCLGMDKPSPKRGNAFSVYGNRSKRDQIGRIIIQEMYEEEDSWCNFPNEEKEVLEMILDEMIGNNLAEIAKETLLELGGTIDIENECDESEIVESVSTSEPENNTVDAQPTDHSESHVEQE